MDRLILASQSPRRKQLLEWAALDFEVLVSDADEEFPPAMNVKEVPVFIARKKAIRVQEKVSGDRVVLAADTIVVLDELIIGKPKDWEDAINILTKLSGQKHLVMTGVVMRQGEKEVSFVDETAVWFHVLDARQIAFYVDHYQPYDKAGAYAIQEWIGVVGIRSIQGDFYNVMGLPVSRVIRELDRWK